jgi:hypothetical protein
MAAKKKSTGKRAGRKRSGEKQASTVCINKDCKLRKQKSCKGFEGCPGFKGR